MSGLPFGHSHTTAVLQGSRIVQRYIDHKKLQRLMKDISGFTASQRMEPGQPVTSIDPKQVHSPHAMTTRCGLPSALFLVAPVCLTKQLTHDDAAVDLLQKTMASTVALSPRLDMHSHAITLHIRSSACPGHIVSVQAMCFTTANSMFTGDACLSAKLCSH